MVYDRVFSLLGLCDEGSDLPVDYDLASYQMAFNIVSRCKQSFCLCSLGFLCEALHIMPGYFGGGARDFGPMKFASISVPVIHFEPVFALGGDPILVRVGFAPRVEESSLCLHPSKDDAEEVESICFDKHNSAWVHGPHSHFGLHRPKLQNEPVFKFASRFLCKESCGFFSLREAGKFVRLQHACDRHVDAPLELPGSLAYQISSDKRNCTIYLTFSMLLYMSQTIRCSKHVRAKRYCNRALNEGPQDEVSDSRVLQLY